MTKKLVSFDDQAEPGEGLPAAVRSELNATYGTDLGRRPVGKDEQIHDVRDHGADPTGSTSSTAAINALLATPGVGRVLIAGGTFLIDGPLLMKRSNQRLTVDESATLSVPSGYTGEVFRLDGEGAQLFDAVVDGGGRVVEIGKSGGESTEPGHWTAVRFHANTGTGNMGCRVEGVQIRWCGTLLKYTTDGTGWVNGCTVSKLTALYPRVFVETIRGSTQVGFSNNTIDNIMGQAGQYTTHGVKTLSGRGWLFTSVNPWDMPAGSVGMDVNEDSRDIRVVAGVLSSRGIVSRAPEGEVTVEDFFTIKPWLGGLRTVTAGEFIPASTGALLATLGTHQLWPVVMLGAGGLTEVSAYYRVPPTVTAVRARAELLGVAASSGAVRTTISLQSAPGATVASVNLVTPVTPNAVSQSAWGDPVVVTPGALMKLTVHRAHDFFAEDNLAGTVGLIGVTVQPTTIRSS